MHIVHIVESLDSEYGGPSQSVPRLARESQRLGAQVSFISANWNKPVQENGIIEQSGSSWMRLTQFGPDKLRYIPRLRQAILQAIATPQTIIHVHNLWNYVPYAAYRIAKRNKIPMIVSLRGTMSDWAWAQNHVAKQIAWRLFQKEMLNAATAIHATSVEEAENCKKRGITAPIYLIPNGVDLGEFSSLPSQIDARTRLGLDSQKHYFLFLSRLHPKKGLEKLIDAWSKLESRVKSQWKLLIVGDSKDPRYRRMLETRTQRKHVSDSVTFAGHIPGDQRLDAYAAADAFVLPSYSENFGIVVLEALAAGLPVITTTGTPWSEIADRGAGYYLDPHVELIAEAMSEIIQSDDLRAKMAKAAQSIAQQYSWRCIGDSFHTVYQRVLNENYYHHSLSERRY